MFQNEVITEMVAGGWKRGNAGHFDRALALYPEDVVGFLKDTQPEQWDKFCALYPSQPEQKFLERVAEHLNKADPLAADKTMRTFGTLGVLRHELRDRGTRFSLCQFKPDHDLNPDTLARYAMNRLRVVPEVVYSPWATAAELATKGAKAKAWLIDLVLFVNGIPVATLELKSEFKPAADWAIKQYRSTRLPVDPVTMKPEPLLTFKRGALVHFAVSQYEVAMTTRLAGEATVFLPFNRGTQEGGRQPVFPRLHCHTEDEDLGIVRPPAQPRRSPVQEKQARRLPCLQHAAGDRGGLHSRCPEKLHELQVAYQLALKIQEADTEVESRKAQVKLNQWVRLHDYNIAQKVQVIVEHFKAQVMGLLGGHAKAMVVTSSRNEAVRYKLSFDKYIAEKGYAKLYGMVAFSGEVEFTEKDPNSAGLLGQKFTEINMNPGLKGRDLRKAFDSADHQVMIVANKFQTGFDQPKLCAMYVDKKLGGVECVQTLSRLNRVYPGKADTGTFILDFFNEPEVILAAFQPYYQTAALTDVSDPNLIFDLNEKLRAAGIFLWTEVEQFCTAFFQKSKSNAARANICNPAVQRWQIRYKAAMLAYQQSRDLLERTKKTGGRGAHRKRGECFQGGEEGERRAGDFQKRPRHVRAIL